MRLYQLARHGGRRCADWVAERLPKLLATHLRDVFSSAAIKEAIKAAFLQCDSELLEQCRAHDWSDGSCAIGMLIDRRCSPARAYCINLGDSRAFAACATQPSCIVRAVPLSKDHTAEDAKERKRIYSAGGYVEAGRICGSLAVSRSFGDARLKQFGLSAIPDVSSYTIGAEQQFVLLACDGLWRVLTGQQAVEYLAERLSKMDKRRQELAMLFKNQSKVSAFTREATSALMKERDHTNEEGTLRALLHFAVYERNATDNCTVVLVRLS